MFPKPKPEKKRRKHHPKSEYKQVVERLDRLVSQIVHLRDGETCVICGSTARPQAGHVFVRDRMRVRWALDNVHVQCAACNLLHRFDQAPYFHWFVQTYGAAAFDSLYDRAESLPYFKFSLPELAELEDALLLVWSSLQS